ncbi:MAG TPA: hypothetical protein VGI82_09315 [Chitinophagaceae bacterium]
MKYLDLFLCAILINASAFCQTSWLDAHINLINTKTSIQETINGVQPAPLKQIAEWSPFFKQEMNNMWQSIGLKGMNYYAIGEPAKDKKYSQRSDFKSKYYQAWFGTYVIDAKNQLFDLPNDSINTSNKEVIEKLVNIGVLDQDSWLYATGDPEALTSTNLIMPKSNFEIIDNFLLDGQHVPVIQFSMNSHSDLTDTATGLTKMIGMPDKSEWESQLQPNHPVVLNGFYIYWYNKKDNTLKIIYGVGCAFSTKNNIDYNTYGLIKKDMLDMAKQMTYIIVK